MKLPKLNQRFCVFLVIFILLFLRAWPRFLYADIWAEDGVFFISDALNFGFLSIFRKGAGYYQLIPRAISWFSLQIFPFAWIPRVFFVSYLFLYAGVFSLWIKEDYAWLIPSRSLRALLILLLVFVPGLGEMTGNLCNLPWIFFFYLAAIALKDPGISIQKSEYVFSVLCAGSTGAVILWLPMMALRLWTRRGRKDFRWESKFLVMGVVWVLMMVISLPAQWIQKTPTDLEVYVQVYFRSLLESVYLQPWWGDRRTELLFQNDTRIVDVALVTLFGGVLIGLFSRGSRSLAHLALAVFLFSVSFWPILTGMTRPDVLTVWMENPSPWFFWHRYSFPMAVAAVIFWMGFINAGREKNRWAILLSLWIGIVGVKWGLKRFKIEPYGTEARWAETAAKLEEVVKTGTGSVNVRTYPDGWAFTYPDR